MTSGRISSLSEAHAVLASVQRPSRPEDVFLAHFSFSLRQEGVDQITKAARRGRTRPGSRSLWFVTAERAREGSSHKGDDVASMPGRSRNILGYYARHEHMSSETDQSRQKCLKRVGASSV